MPSVLKGTIQRSFEILRFVAMAETPVSVSEVSDALDLPMSTCHRLLNALIDEGMLLKHEATRRYAVGPGLHSLAGAVAERTSLLDLARPAMRVLAERTGETVLLGIYVRARQRMMFVGKEDSREPLRYRVTLNVPLSLVWGASGRAILAFLPAAAVKQILSAVEPSPGTGEPLDRRRLNADLALIRERGWAISQSEKVDGAVGIAAPITAGDQEVVGCLCLTTPAVRFQEEDAERLGTLVQRIASTIPASAARHEAPSAIAS